MEKFATKMHAKKSKNLSANFLMVKSDDFVFALLLQKKKKAGRADGPSFLPKNGKQNLENGNPVLYRLGVMQVGSSRNWKFMNFHSSS